MSIFSNPQYPQSQYQQPQQPNGGFFTDFMGTSSQQLNPQTIQLIMQQLQQQGLPPQTLDELTEVLNEIQYNGTEKILSVLNQQSISQDLKNIILNKLDLEELEDSKSGVPQRRSMPPRRSISVAPGFPRSAPYGANTGYGANTYGANTGYGGKRRRTRRRRKQRGGNCGGYSSNTPSYGSNAALVGGRRKRRTRRR